MRDSATVAKTGDCRCGPLVCEGQGQVFILNVAQIMIIPLSLAEIGVNFPTLLHTSGLSDSQVTAKLLLAAGMLSVHRGRGSVDLSA